MEQLVDFFQDKLIKQVLDIGTGTGEFISVLRKTFPKAAITGIDPNTENILPVISIWYKYKCQFQYFVSYNNSYLVRK